MPEQLNEITLTDVKFSFPKDYFSGILNHVPRHLRCVRCGQRVRGLAMIGGDRFCDLPHSTSCYDLALTVNWQDPDVWEMYKRRWESRHLDPQRIMSRWTVDWVEDPALLPWAARPETYHLADGNDTVA